MWTGTRPRASLLPAGPQPAFRRLVSRPGPGPCYSAGRMPPQNHPGATSGTPLGRYWLANLRLMAVLLLAWGAAGLGCGVLFADRLNEWGFMLGGFPLGFWFAQQGSILVFILLILIYAVAMNRLDARHHRDRVTDGMPSESRTRRSGDGPRGVER
jgi:putative solute:sodium symporter small subunit